MGLKPLNSYNKIKKVGRGGRETKKVEKFLPGLIGKEKINYTFGYIQQMSWTERVNCFMLQLDLLLAKYNNKKTPQTTNPRQI